MDLSLYLGRSMPLQELQTPSIDTTKEEGNPSLAKASRLDHLSSYHPPGPMPLPPPTGIGATKEKHMPVQQADR